MHFDYDILQATFFFTPDGLIVLKALLNVYHMRLVRFHSICIFIILLTYFVSSEVNKSEVEISYDIYC